MSGPKVSKNPLINFFLSERAMMTIIFLNAIVIFFMYFRQFEHSWHLRFFDQLFIGIFVVEAIIKMSFLGPRSYFSDRWNQFDFFIVIASVPSLLMNFIDLPDTSWLLILRLFRLLRLVRFFNFIPHMGKIVEGLARAIRASVFVLLALFFLNFMLAIFTCHFYRNVAPDYFGDPLISAYSIFQMFTVEGWNEIPKSISENMDNAYIIGITRFYFVLVVLIGGIFGMSLANAVFVDEMTLDNNSLLEKKIDQLQAQIEELKGIIKSKENRDSPE